MRPRAMPGVEVKFLIRPSLSREAPVVRTFNNQTDSQGEMPRSEGTEGHLNPAQQGARGGVAEGKKGGGI